MASAAFGSADIFSGNPGALSGCQFFVKPFEPVIKPVFSELDFGCAVAIDAPSHAEHLHLLDPVHRFYIAMTGFAGNFSCIYMLGMIKISMVGKVMHLYPLDRFA